MWLIKVFSAICKFLGNSFFNLNKIFVINIYIFMKKIITSLDRYFEFSFTGLTAVCAAQDPEQGKNCVTRGFCE